ncbi:methyltransferase domain-containing protein [Nostocoides sp. F2B08]|uniref:methyltransferase domain-containing protein n=1 Tax=Nostocoides sp. F2B08 TaxID=2653936 RepID=UPI0012635F7D|nr:methyltransferase domain-containing protein [Tetrasphaera sp. F2B08]KAB7743502.1 methyltransferase domain-containing protein [Tetrasphaera sp. F2B08]
MAETTWDPTQYARFGDERGRPFRDLLARVGAAEPAVVVDLGCGNGPLTLTLSARWPRAEVIGLDSSPEMLEAARTLDTDGSVRWVRADLRDWDPSSLGVAPDVVVTNATLQWVPDHVHLITRVVSALAPGGWFAMQVPDNFGAPSHALMRDAASAHRRSTDLLPAVSRLAVEPPEAYLELLAGLGCEVDVWSTTYLHVLDPAGEVDDPVLEWVRGTGLRPVLAVLTDPDEREEFLADYRARLREAYPRSAAGVVMSFRRTFAVAHTREA